jgi:Family of unknown function (DUF6519)
MSGDYSRFTFDPERRFSTLYLRQGALWLDQDKNEDGDIQRRASRTLAEDVLGTAGMAFARWPDAFRIGHLPGPPEDLSVEAGRMYPFGIQIEHFEDENATYLAQPFLPLPPPLPVGEALVYLRIWDREITWVEDFSLLDVALHGIDTSTRLQTVWQILVESTSDDELAECNVVPPLVSDGRLSTAAIAPPAPTDPCIVPPLVGYRGLENLLYKVMIFEGGPLGTARFMFSREGGSVVSAVQDIAVGAAETTLTVNRVGRDPVLRFEPGNWVTVTDDVRELMLMPPEPALIIDIDEANQRIVLDRVLPAHNLQPFGANPAEIQARHTKITRWDQDGSVAPIDAQGLITTQAAPIEIEAGIQLTLSTAFPGGEFLTGDCWRFATRVVDASVEQLTVEPPERTYHIVQLGAAHDLGGQNPVIDDCRPPPPETHSADCCCCEITVSANPEDGADFTTIAAAVAALSQVAPNEEEYVIICLQPGRYEIDAQVPVTRPRVTIRGCGQGTQIIARRGGAIELLGPENVLENLAVLGETQSSLVTLAGPQKAVRQTWLTNLGPGPTLAGLALDEADILDTQSTGSGGFDLRGSRIVIRGNGIQGGPIRLGQGSTECQIENNTLRDSALEGIILGATGVAFEIDVVGNRIIGARRHGIASGHFDPENNGGDGIIDGLRIQDNEITDCIDRDAERSSDDPPFAGIALGRIYDLDIRHNSILRNGLNSAQPCCGIYVRHSRGARIEGNTIERNGRERGDASPVGVQGGIVLLDARAAMAGILASGQDQVGFADMSAAGAAHITGNAVSAPRGQALRIEGQGPMRITDNRFQARDLLGRSNTDNAESPFGAVAAYVASVFVLNLGLPSWLGSLGAALGFDLVTTEGINALEADEFLGFVTAGGQTQFRGNQVRLDLTSDDLDVVLANVCILGLDDTLISSNQTEGILSVFRAGNPDFAGTIAVAPNTASQFASDLLMSDILNFALTTRQTNNGCMTTPLMTIYSILSRGVVNHCTHNQTTSCISATGTSAKSITEGNAVLYPHPVFCPEDDSN